MALAISVQYFVNSRARLRVKKKPKTLPTVGIEPLTLRVGILPLYQVIPGGYRLFCTAYKCYMFVNRVVNS